MFDLTGSYRMVWIFCVLLSVIAAAPLHANRRARRDAPAAQRKPGMIPQPHRPLLVWAALLALLAYASYVSFRILHEP